MSLHWRWRAGPHCGEEARSMLHLCQVRHIPLPSLCLDRESSTSSCRCRKLGSLTVDISPDFRHVWHCWSLQTPRSLSASFVSAVSTAADRHLQPDRLLGTKTRMIASENEIAVDLALPRAEVGSDQAYPSSSMGLCRYSGSSGLDLPRH